MTHLQIKGIVYTMAFCGTTWELSLTMIFI